MINRFNILVEIKQVYAHANIELFFRNIIEERTNSKIKVAACRHVKNGWPDILSKDTLQKDILPKTDILPKDILPNGHVAERTV